METTKRFGAPRVIEMEGRMVETIFVGKGESEQVLVLKRANRHGLIAGATGTGKTVTLQVLAEHLSEAGVPVFAADVKGDLSGLAAPGSSAHKAHPKLQERAAGMGLADYPYKPAPVVFWDVFGENGHPIRVTIADMGPVLLARILDLSDAQEGALTVAFHYADEEGLLLLDLKDLKALLTHCANAREEISAKYGLVSPQSLAAIQRAVLQLEMEGADAFFGEPALDLEDFLRTTRDGRGLVNILAAEKLIGKPRLYATFLLWMMSELFEMLPEVGDPDKPVLVFFFDEAHLLFNDAPKPLLEKVEQVARLIRSKGVGIYFVTQQPQDVPETILAQLGNRVQHALRAYTPTEMKAVKIAAQSFRNNPAFDEVEALQQLGVGEALVSFLDGKGVPTIVERALIRPPQSRLGPLTAEERRQIRADSPIGTRYDRVKDRESAYEILEARAAKAAEAAEAAARDEAREKEARGRDAPARRPARRSTSAGVFDAFLKTATREVTRYVVRGVMGTRRRR